MQRKKDRFDGFPQTPDCGKGLAAAASPPKSFEESARQGVARVFGKTIEGQRTMLNTSIFVFYGNGAAFQVPALSGRISVAFRGPEANKKPGYRIDRSAITLTFSYHRGSELGNRLSNLSGLIARDVITAGNSLSGL
jgi:hypothetical protein